MGLSEMENMLRGLGIIPVVKIDRAEDAIPVAEITFRTDDAAEAIQLMAREKDILVGAGTVLTTLQVDVAAGAGASFIVSPGFNPKVIRRCLETGIPVFPGVSNPTDIEMALDMGLNTVKFFPAEAFGGVRTLEAISAPYNMMRFIPTGGINPGNIARYLALPQVVACGGSWMVDPKLLEKKDFKEISRLSAEAVALANQARQKT